MFVPPALHMLRTRGGELRAMPTDGAASGDPGATFVWPNPATGQVEELATSSHTEWRVRGACGQRHTQLLLWQHTPTAACTQVESFDGVVNLKGVCGACLGDWEGIVGCGGSIVFATLGVEARWTPPACTSSCHATTPCGDCGTRSCDHAHGVKSADAASHRTDGDDTFPDGYSVSYTLTPSTDCCNFINEFCETPVWSTENLAKSWTTPHLRSISNFKQWCYRAFTPLARAWQRECERQRETT